MAQQSVCAHCGFRNTSMSYFCARCEQPLRNDERPATPTGEAPAAAAKQVARQMPKQAATQTPMRKAGPTATVADPPNDRTEVTQSPFVPPKEVPQSRQAKPVNPGPPPRVASPKPRAGQAPTEVMPPVGQKTLPVPQATLTQGADLLYDRATQVASASLMLDWASQGSASAPAPASKVPTPLGGSAQKAAPPRGAAAADVAERGRQIADEAPGLGRQIADDVAGRGRQNADDVPRRGRQIAALGVDTAVAAAAMVAYGVLEMALVHGGWPSQRATGLEAVAWWIYVYHRSVRRILLVGLTAAAVHTFFGVRTGHTLGRSLFGLTLTPKDAAPKPTGTLPWSTALWHLAGGALCLMSLGAGVYWMVVDARGRTWANLLSRTVVVRRA